MRRKGCIGVMKEGRSHGTHEIRPGLAGSQPGPADVRLMTQVILGGRCCHLGCHSADVGFVDLSSFLF